MKSKKDTTHRAIASELEALGCWVMDLSTMKNGAPDMLCYNRLNGQSFFIEAKTGKAKLRENQMKWHKECPLPVYILRSEMDAKNLILLNIYNCE